MYTRFRDILYITHTVIFLWKQDGSEILFNQGMSSINLYFLKTVNSKGWAYTSVLKKLYEEAGLEKLFIKL